MDAGYGMLKDDRCCVAQLVICHMMLISIQSILIRLCALRVFVRHSIPRRSLILRAGDDQSQKSARAWQQAVRHFSKINDKKKKISRKNVDYGIS